MIANLRFSFASYWLVLWCSAVALAQDSQSRILDVFPDSTVSGQGTHTTWNQQFTKSPSRWDERLDERPVFHVEMQHRGSEEKAYSLRIGKGGQVYSLRGPFGESVPPSWRAEGSHVSPWNDEVWQFVAVCTRYNGLKELKKAGPIPAPLEQAIRDSRYRDTFFIHNSGAYIPGDSKVRSLYCPLLASEIDHELRACRMLNWGLIPQVRTIHRSPLLYYTQVRDAADGIIELTWVVHNFSVREDIVFDHLNAPWGGTRISSLPLRFVSSPEGELLDRKGFLNAHGAIDVRKTGGWNLSCVSLDDTSPALALVYGRDRHLERERQRKADGEPYCQENHSLYRDWRANEGLYQTRWKDWATRPSNSFRNYDVCEIIPKLVIRPGTSIWFRSFLVVGVKKEVIEKAKFLVDRVDYGLVSFDDRSTDKRKVSVSELGREFHVFTKPVPGSMPVFRIENEDTGQHVLTSDPYLFVNQETLDWSLPNDHPARDYIATVRGYSMDQHNSRWKELVGYALKQKPAIGNWTRLSSLLPPTSFPKPNEYHLDLWVEVTP